MSAAHDIIKRPIITEKSTADAAIGKYTFEVATHATKTQVRQAVEQLFSVKVVKVNTTNYDGKIKRQGVHIGPRNDWKKAVVTIDTEPKAGSYLQKGGKTATAPRKFKNTIEEFGFGQ
ncbi:MAG: 50S ribosomal protein L23 [Eubacteriales bacterium]|nr:50S ribosomal protein L23 [Eubacteriales bacterium]